MAKPLHHSVKDIRGQRFGRLIVLDYLGARRWRCKCDCGNETENGTGNLHSGTTLSCGCFQRDMNSLYKTTHGMSDGPEHRTWVNMKYRCHNPNAANYARYGGAGIMVCARWRDDFATFYSDMGPKPSSRYSIDRIDGSRGYEPGNCRWALGTTQHRNKSSNRRISFRGRSLTIEEWSQETGLNRETIAQRLHRGWNVARALTEPAANR